MTIDEIQESHEATEKDVESPSDQHQWSGWPGAYCIKCGIPDQNEACIADHDTILYCVEGHFMCEERHQMAQCPEHKNPPCVSRLDNAGS